MRRRTWFTLFFAPIFPFGHGSYSIACASCGTSYGITREVADKFIADYEAQQVNAGADRAQTDEDTRIAAEQQDRGEAH